jgi:hypothetical protein
MIRSVTVLALAVLAAAPALAQSCVGSPVAVQVLGSNGPALNRDRASASYLLWVGPQAKVLVDLGGGSHLRYAQSQAKFADLSLIAVSHLHPVGERRGAELLGVPRSAVRSESGRVSGAGSGHG